MNTIEISSDLAGTVNGTRIDPNNVFDQVIIGHTMNGLDLTTTYQNVLAENAARPFKGVIVANTGAVEALMRIDHGSGASPTRYSFHPIPVGGTQIFWPRSADNTHLNSTIKAVDIRGISGTTGKVVCHGWW